MILTLKELAKHLRVNERTILRMQQTGQIKGVKIGGQWRFNGSEIDRLFFPDAATAESGEGLSVSDLSRSHLSVPVSRLVRDDRMTLDMKATTAEDAIDELCDVVKRCHLVLDMGELRDKLLEREKLLSTGVGNGLAIPHPRDPMPTLPELAAIVVGRSDSGIDFGAVDGKPVRLFFLLCCQNIEMHLHMMGQLAHLLRHDEAVAKMKATADPHEFLRTILEVERGTFLDETA